jgi:hypothetical protein
MLALIGTVGLATFTGLTDAHFSQHVGIIGCCNLTKAVLVGTVASSEHHELSVCCKRDASYQHRPEKILQGFHTHFIYWLQRYKEKSGLSCKIDIFLVIQDIIW